MWKGNARRSQTDARFSHYVAVKAFCQLLARASIDCPAKDSAGKALLQLRVEANLRRRDGVEGHVDGRVLLHFIALFRLERNPFFRIFVEVRKAP